MTAEDIERAVEAAGGVLFEASDGGRVTHLGAAWSTWTGRPASACLGAALWDLALHGEPCRRLIAGDVASARARMRREDGSAWPVTLHYDRATGAGVMLDATAVVATEERLARIEESERDLLGFSRALQGAESYGDVLRLAQDEVQRHIGYRTVWMMLLPRNGEGDWRMLALAGDKVDALVRDMPILDHTNDPMLQEILRGSGPVVVDDARTDPRTNKDIVAVLGNRTIVNVPLLMTERPLGAFGTGTFAPEPPRPPAPAETAYLEAMAGQIAVAAARIGIAEERRRAESERAALEEQLRQTQRLESLGLMAGGVAHDLNNLLVGILSNAEFARDRAHDPREKDAIVGEIVDAASQAADLARLMLGYAGSGVPRATPFDLAETLRAMATLLRASVPRSVRLTLPDAAPLHAIAGDETQLQQVVLNLVANAAEAIGDGEGAIDVEIGRCGGASDAPGALRFGEALPPGDYVRLRVRDTGGGMDEATRRRMCDPFFSTKATGHGLGMASVLGIVRGHGGALWVASSPGRGTVMDAVFPETTAPVVATQRVSAADRPFAPATVLVVDDQAIVRTVSSRILEAEGLVTHTAEDGVTAIAALRQRAAEIDAVILDLSMPGMSGKDTLAELRRIRPDLPVLISSGFTREAVSPLLAGDAPTAFLSKPFLRAELLQQLASVLSPAR